MHDHHKVLFAAFAFKYIVHKLGKTIPNGSCNMIELTVIKKVRIFSHLKYLSQKLLVLVYESSKATSALRTIWSFTFATVDQEGIFGLLYKEESRK